MNDGSAHEAVEEHNRGSAANPMTQDEIIAKFYDNAADLLTPGQRDRLVETTLRLDSLERADALIDLAVPL